MTIASCDQPVSDVVERFMRYVQTDSQSDPENFDETPSTPCQHDMARVVADDLIALGLSDVVCDEHAYVTATLPASPGLEHLPALGFCAHLDTSFDCCASGVRPHIVHYEGGNLVAGVVDGREVYTTPQECPYLNQFVGEDIICSDGSTLLSTDDKAAIAEIIALVARYLEHPELTHPTLKLAFVPDEEIGHGARLLDLDAFGARWCYTLDTDALGKFNYECFYAAQAKVYIDGVMIHPGSAKGVMINAITLLHEFERMIPGFERPEHTDGYEGFYHPFSVEGTASGLVCTYIIRDFFTTSFAERKERMQKIADYINERHGKELIRVEITDQYKNMVESFEDCRFLIDNVLHAYKETGITPEVCPIRGGTDGAQLSFRGLPCPNIATGGVQFHSEREFIPVRALETTVDMLVNLVNLFCVDQPALGEA